MKKPLLALLLVCMSVLVFGRQAPPKREIRGAWIATFSNIDWPNRTQTPAQQRAAFLTILEHHKATGLNTLYIQVRSQCDAMYPSPIEPWSADLTGTQGKAPSPDWDPLQFMIDECHKRGIEFHAWINPYRAVSNSANLPGFAANHVAKLHPDWLLSQGILRVLDPGLQDVRNYITSVIVDIVDRYNVDGIHFDDYFYPPAAPAGTTPYNDDSSFTLDPRGFTNRADWRRDNVSLLIKRLNDTIQVLKPWVKFGVSPSGIYRNSTNPAIGTPTSGLEHYTTLYADTKKWLQEGWVDYIAPQVYWYIGQPGANYAAIVPWWNNQANGRHIYIGMAGYKVNDPAQGVNWANPSMIPNEMRMNRDPLYPNIKGQAIYNTSSMRSTTKLGFRDSLRLFFYQKPALLPRMPWRDSIAPGSPATLTAVKYPGDSVVLNWVKPAAPTELDKAIRFVIYRSEDTTIDISDVNNILAITNTDTATFADKTGLPGTTYYYTVTALDHFHNESMLSNTVSNLPPSIVGSGNQTIYLDDTCAVVLPGYTTQALVNGQAAVPGIAVTQSPVAGTLIHGRGDITVTLTATDAAANTGNYSLTVSIKDSIPPLITALDSTLTNGSVKVFPADSAACSFTAGTQLDIQGTDGCGNTLTYAYTLTYQGLSQATVNANSLQGVIFQPGSTLVNWRVSDEAGNATNFGYTVKVEDKESPLITNAAANPAEIWPPTLQMKDVTIDYVATDNCGPVTTTLSVSSNEPVTGGLYGNLAPDWVIVDQHHVKLRAERGLLGNGRLYTITITATDSAGNSRSQQVNVSVPRIPNDPFPDGILTVKAFPNPSPTQFYVLTLSTSLKPLSIIVTDNTGRTIESRTGLAANGLFNLGAGYRPGVYYLQVKQGNNTQTVKLIKL
ncbi:family 10 glycosylhydrolase [Paraflavitalea speifideaquila]|uniref:family 10 glycosylhydrolase n=1 Tax=Paraflavitalea speifideaquila TaxID=3076558 RepID=UPI0028F12E06|nr:family 10 glycosylhydrolase [Paraflavitalea speifideiaquila]